VQPALSGRDAGCEGCECLLTRHLDALRLAGLAPATLDARRRSLARLTALLHLRERHLLSAGGRDLVAWQESLPGGVEGRRNHVLHAVGFYRWGMQLALVGPGVLDLLTVPRTPGRVDHSRRRPFTTDPRRPDPAELQEHVETLRLRNLAETTIRERRYAIRSLERYLQGHGTALLEADEMVLDAWQRSRQRVTPSSRRNGVTHVQQFYGWAVDAGRITRNPSSRLVLPKSPQRLPRPIDRTELAMALANAPTRIRPWLLLACWAGLRASEIAFLSRQDVMETAEPPVLLVHGKGGKQRVVPLSAQLLAELPLPRSGPLWRRHNGKPMGRSGPSIVSDQCNRYLHGVGVTASLHQLRHRFATDVYATSGHDLRLVQELLGHANPATTSGYAALSPGAAVEAVGAVALLST